MRAIVNLKDWRELTTQHALQEDPRADKVGIWKGGQNEIALIQGKGVIRAQRRPLAAAIRERLSLARWRGSETTFTRLI